MIKNPYECCIFDLDGTLLDTSRGLLNSLDYTIEKCGLPPFPEEKRLSIIGPPIKTSLKKQYRLSEEKANEALAVFREYYETKELFSAALYPGISELLPALRDRGIKVALGTYKVERFALRLLEHFNIRPYFTFVGAADPAGKMSKTDILNLCAGKMNGGRKDGILMIGDSEFDAVGAREAHMDFLAVTYGFGFKKDTDLGGFPHVGICNSVKEVGDFCGLY